MKPEAKIHQFQSREILNSASGMISKIYLGKVMDEDAILILNKIPLEDTLSMENENTLNENDVYTMGTFELRDTVKYTLIHPASQVQIKKYTAGRHFMLQETPEMYHKVILPLCISQSSKCAWIDNIFRQLEGCTDISRTLPNGEILLHIEPDFVILPDAKWDRKSPDSLYLLVLFRDPSLYTIRELRDTHTEMLLRVRAAMDKTLEIYGKTRDRVKMYFHYHPTFYRLHLHASYLQTTWPGESIGSSVLLHDVLENLKISPAFYNERAMEIHVKSTSFIYGALAKQENKKTPGVE